MKKAIRNKRVRFVKDIIIGVVVTLICNLLMQLFNNFPQVGKTVFSTIQNFVFSSAAQASSNTIIIMIFEMIMGFIFSFTISHLINSFIYYREEKKIIKYERAIKEIESDITKNPENYVENKQRLENVSKEFAVFAEKYKDKNNKRIKTSIIISFMTIIVFIYTVYISISLVIPVLLFDRFNRDIRMIKPYADSYTIMVFESDWTRMKTVDDYNALYYKIKMIKEDNSLP